MSASDARIEDSPDIEGFGKKGDAETSSRVAADMVDLFLCTER